MTQEKLSHPKAQKHGEIKLIFDNIWFVQGTVKMPMLMPMKISQSMTILKNPDNNELCLVNSMRLTDAGLRQLEKLGKVTSIIRIAGFHGKDDGFYRERYQAKIYAIKGQVYTRRMDTKTSTQEGYLQPDVWLDKDSDLPIPAATLKVMHSCDPSEAILKLERDGGILIAGDSLQNTAAADQYANFLAKIMMKKMGFYEAFQVGPGWIQFAKPDEIEVRSILDLDFEHVLPGHGNPVINNAKDKYRPALEGKFKGCH